jgi:hypothetical protein
MKRIILVSTVVFLLLTGCSKSNNSKTGGTETIETTLYGTGPYYAMGFSFSDGKLVSTNSNPVPDITIIADVDIDGTIRRLMLQAENLKNSFYKYGIYGSSAEAESAFKSLTSASVAEWKEIADTLKPNQIWLYRSATEHYTKFRVISTVAEQRNGTAYGSCTFQWAYQPDGTLTFPAE